MKLNAANLKLLDQEDLKAQKKAIKVQMANLTRALEKLDARKAHEENNEEYKNADNESQTKSGTTVAESSHASNERKIAPEIAPKIPRVVVKFYCLNQATVEIYGEATKLMQQTRAATLLCKIVSPSFRNQIKEILEPPAPLSELFGLCTYHKLITQPWTKGADAKLADGCEQADAILCCIRRELAFKEPDSVLAEVTFLKKDGTLMYVEEVAALGDIDKTAVSKQSPGETSKYLGKAMRTIYETAKKFEISIETSCVMPVVACTEFDSAKTLHDEIERRAAFFEQKKKAGAYSGKPSELKRME